VWRCYKNSQFLLRFILRYQSMVLYGNYDRYRVPRKSPKRARGERPSPGRPPWGISTAPPSTGICQIGQSHLTVLSSTTRLLSCTSMHVLPFALFPSVYRSRRNVLLCLSTTFAPSGRATNRGLHPPQWNAPRSPACSFRAQSVSGNVGGDGKKERNGGVCYKE
jgi:hypothetical protein